MKLSRLVVLLSIYQAVLLAFAILRADYAPTPSDEVFALIMLLFVPVVMRKRVTLKVAIFFFCYAIVGVLGAISSPFRGVPQPWAALYDVALDMKLPIIFLGFIALISLERQPEKMLDGVCLSLIIFALISAPFVIRDLIVNSGSGIYGQPLTPRLGFYQPQGLLKHHTDSVWRTFIAALCALHLLLKKKKLIYLIVFITLAILTLLHLSTKEVLALFLCTAMAVVGSRNRYKAMAYTVVAALVFVPTIVLFTPIGELISSQFSAYFGSASYDEQARTMLTLKSLPIALDFFPFGSGSGTYASPPSFQLGYSEVYYFYGLSNVWGASPDAPEFLVDVFWPKILAQGGFIGALFYIGLFSTIFGPALKDFVFGGERRLWLAGAVTFACFLFSAAATPYTQEFMVVVVTFFAAYFHSMRKRLNSATQSSPHIRGELDLHDVGGGRVRSYPQ